MWLFSNIFTYKTWGLSKFGPMVISCGPCFNIVKKYREQYYEIWMFLNVCPSFAEHLRKQLRTNLQYRPHQEQMLTWTGYLVDGGNGEWLVDLRAI